MPKTSLLPQDTAPTMSDRVVILDVDSTTTKTSELTEVAELIFDQDNQPSGGGSVKTRHNESLNDHIASGGEWSADSLGSTRNGSMSALVGYVNGKRLSVNAVSARSFTASKDTYIFLLSDGTLDYEETTNGSTVPTQPADSIPLGLVVTDASAITKVIEFGPRTPNEIARSKIVSGGDDNLDVFFIPSGWRALEIKTISYASGGTIDSTMRFNNDSGTNYAYYQASLMAAGSSLTSQSGFGYESGATDSGGTSFGIVEVTNISNQEKLFVHHSVSQDATGGATVPASLETMGKYKR